MRAAAAFAIALAGTAAPVQVDPSDLSACAGAEPQCGPVASPGDLPLSLLQLRAAGSADIAGGSKCAVHGQYNSMQAPVKNCKSDAFPEGSHFCLHGAKFTVKKSWNTGRSGATVNIEGRFPSRDFFKEGDLITPRASSCVEAETDVVEEVREHRRYCHLGESLPQWLLAGASTQIAISCAEDESVCEQLKQSVDVTCGGTLTGLSCSTLQSTTKTLKKGLMVTMSDGDEAQHPCAPLMSSFQAGFKDVCFANNNGCGAVVKTTGGTCEATCAKAGLSCLSSYGTRAAGEKCGKWWTGEKQACSTPVDAHAICECTVEPAKAACEEFEGFNLLDDFKHCNALDYDKRHQGVYVDKTILRLGKCKEAVWEALVPAGTLTFKYRQDESKRRDKSDSMTVFVNGKQVKRQVNDGEGDMVIEVKDASTVRVKAQSGNTDTFLHMRFKNLHECEVPITKKMTSDQFHFHGHNFLCSDFEP